MFFFTVVFTLHGRDPAENKYVNMFWLMFQSLCRTGSFNMMVDKMYVMADEKTWLAIQQVWLMDGETAFPNWIPIPQPTTLLEGISRRYEILEKLPEFLAQATGLYLDVDILCRRKFSLELPIDTIAVYTEGGSADPNYCGEAGWAQLDHPGLSAGFWAIRGGPNMKALMSEIRASIARGPHTFYTVEQPHFNSCITKKTRAVYFHSRIVSFNGHGMTPETCFINCAGCPGDGPFHYEKMCSLLSRSIINAVHSG